MFDPCVKVTGQDSQGLVGQQSDDMYILECNSLVHVVYMFVCVCVCDGRVKERAEE